jgi:hypothetical protein
MDHVKTPRTPMLNWHNRKQAVQGRKRRVALRARFRSFPGSMAEFARTEGISRQRAWQLLRQIP